LRIIPVSVAIQIWVASTAANITRLATDLPCAKPRHETETSAKHDSRDQTCSKAEADQQGNDTQQNRGDRSRWPATGTR